MAATVIEQYTYEVIADNAGSPENGARVVGFNVADTLIIDETTTAGTTGEFQVEAARYSVSGEVATPTIRNPYDIRVLKYGIVFFGFGKTFAAKSLDTAFVEDNDFITEPNKATVLGYPGITFDHANDEIEINSGTWNTERLYDRSQAEGVDTPQAEVFELLVTIDGNAYTQNYDIIFRSGQFDGQGASYASATKFWRTEIGNADLTNITVPEYQIGDVPGTLTNVGVTGDLIVDVSQSITLQNCTIERAVENAGGSPVTLTLVNSTVNATLGNVILVAAVGITFTGFTNGTEIRIYDAGTNNEVDGTESATDPFLASLQQNDPYDIVAIKPGFIPIRLENRSFASDQSVNLNQQVDRNFENP